MSDIIKNDVDSTDDDNSWITSSTKEEVSSSDLPKERRTVPPDWDGQKFDEVHIRTVPRYKMSDLSGNEWRISVYVDFKRKNKVYKTTRYHNVRSALEHVHSDYVAARDDFMNCDTFDDKSPLCDQEGCAEQSSVTYKLKKRKLCDCGSLHDVSHDVPSEVRKFCARHSTRGNGCLEDADDNYVLLEGDGPQACKAIDESPSVFGGII